MESISIVCLIYQSVEYIDFVYKNIYKYTPELNNKDSEFLFVANDATEEVICHLKNNNYNFLINNNKKYSEQELFKMGFAYPEYINRVYIGYNVGIKNAKNNIIVLINSDNCFSKDWLKNLMKHHRLNTVVSPRMVQPNKAFRNPKNGTFSECVDFGNSIKTYKEQEFLNWVENHKKETTSPGNPFMPVIIHKKQIEKVGYYPEGNLHNGNYNKIKFTGDHEFFNRLEKSKITHITSNDSIIYHFNEGEKYKKI
jgi:hypothetical protein